MIKEKMWDVIRFPIKSKLSLDGKYFFKIRKDYCKKDVTESCEEIFKVKVLKVNIINIPGEEKFFRGKKGFRPGYKKAIVTLQKGSKLNLKDF